eukprot:1157991-Pelagomonas_calceolata.AAC.5
MVKGGQQRERGGRGRMAVCKQQRLHDFMHTSRCGNQAHQCKGDSSPVQAGADDWAAVWPCCPDYLLLPGHKLVGHGALHRAGHGHFLHTNARQVAIINYAKGTRFPLHRSVNEREMNLACQQGALRHGVMTGGMPDAPASILLRGTQGSNRALLGTAIPPRRNVQATRSMVQV